MNKQQNSGTMHINAVLMNRNACEYRKCAKCLHYVNVTPYLLPKIIRYICLEVLSQYLYGKES